MPRVFRHYVPPSFLMLVGAEGVIVFGSVYVGLTLPLLGMTEILPARGQAAPMALALSLLVLVMGHIAGLYDMRQRYGRSELSLRLGVAFLGAYLVTAVLGYFATVWFLGRKAYLLSFLVAFPLALVLRLEHDRFTADSRHRRRVLLLGSGRGSQTIGETINGSHHAYELIGCVDGHPDRIGEDVNGVKILGSVDDLAWLAKIARPDVIVVAMQDRRGTLPLAEIIECKFQGIEVEDWPDFYEKLTGKIPINDLRPSWLVFSDGFRKRQLTLLAKRAMDLLVSSAGLLVTLPVIGLIAVLIKRDSPGPVFFRQERLGQHGRIFSVVKFRSMEVGRPVVTGVGRFLRRTRLDELPQLFNVLRGEMSLVGPRPEWVALVPEFREQVPFYVRRLAVKPGITGWAQVHNPYGASVDNTLEKLQYDLYYIKNMSIFLDLLILLHTIQIVLFTRGSEPWTNKPPRESTPSASFAG